jgi:sirohydrochlorin cobaltochelatase
MAAWLCATIILENVDARCEEERLFLPAGSDFTLKDQVKSVITVLAKTHHYWEAHLASRAATAAATSETG